MAAAGRFCRQNCGHGRRVQRLNACLSKFTGCANRYFPRGNYAPQGNDGSVLLTGGAESEWKAQDV